jgi:hypothetical protein
MVKNNFNSNLHLKHKVLILLLLIVLFTFLYYLYDDTNYGGISNIQELIKEELIKTTIKDKIKEKFQNLNLNNQTKINSNYFNSEMDEDIEINISSKEDKDIDDTAKEIKKAVETTELKQEKIKPNMFQKIFNRLYFSVVTATTLGYGDIYPITIPVKILTMMQTISTIILILL